MNQLVIDYLTESGTESLIVGLAYLLSAFDDYGSASLVKNSPRIASTLSKCVSRFHSVQDSPELRAACLDIVNENLSAAIELREEVGRS